MDDNKLTEIEKALFASLDKTKMPEVALEATTIEALKRKGLIKQVKARKIFNWKTAAAIAASVLMFFFGHYFGGLIMGQGPSSGYVLLLHEDENFLAGDPAELYSEYESWMIDIFTKGYDITGNDLANEAVDVGWERKSTGEDRITGYFIIQAGSLEEVLKIAETSPHIKYGGTIEVKEIVVQE